MSELPQNWILANFLDIFDIQGGTQPPKSTFKYKFHPGYIQLLQIRDFGERPVSTYIEDTDYLKKCTEEDILIARYGASLGRILTGLSGAYNVAMAKVIIPSGMNRRFVYHLLTTELFQAPLRLISRSAQSGFNKQDLAEITFPIPPLNEQKLIADKLDRLLAKVDACRDRLDRIPRIIEHFRQSVLLSAMSGELIACWRTNRAEDSINNSQETSGQLAEFADIIDPNPSHRYPSYEGGIIPLLSTEQMSGLNGWNISSAKLITSDFYNGRKASHNFLNDDIIFARKGRFGLARNPPQSSRYVFSHTVFIIRAKSDKIMPAYLLWFLRQQWCIEWLLLEMNSNAGVPTLGKSVMERLPIQVPDYAEQQEVVRCIEKLFAYADYIETHYEKAYNKIAQLSPVLLDMAFCGELVQQDPADEPASVLLERIRIAKASPMIEPRVSNARRSTMTKLSQESVKEVINQLPNDKFSFEELREKISGDYDLLKDIFFTLLDETDPLIEQVFDRQAKTMCFVRGNK